MHKFILLNLLFISQVLFGQNRVVTGDIFPNVNVEKNYIVNGTFDQNVNGVSAYDDAASRPVDGTGGTSTTTCTRNTTTPIEGNGSLIITKTAANLQGEGCGISFTIPSREYAKVLQIEFDYKVVSGTFAAGSSSADSDIIVYLYDVTNSKLIEPSSFKLFTSSTSFTDKFIGNFQTSATGTTYRLLFHVATTSASAFVVEFDKVSVSRSKYVYGTPITDWQAYTPVFTGFGTVSVSNIISRKVGDSLEVRGTFTSGTPTSTEARMTLGYSGASGNVTTKSSLPTISVAGVGKSNNSQTSTDFQSRPVLIEPSKNYMVFSAEYSTFGSGLGKANGDGMISAGAILSISASFPIEGWSSSVRMSTGFESRTIVLAVGKSTSQSITTSTATITGWGTPSVDLTGSFNSTTGIWTSPASDCYAIQGSIGSQNTGTFSFNLRTQIDSVTVINGTSSPNAVDSTTAITPLHVACLRAGQTVNLAASVNTGTQDTAASATINRLTIFKLGQNQAIVDNPNVTAIYRISANKTPAINSPVDYDTKIDDTHNAVTTGTGWRFTAPIFGFYKICVTSATSTTGGTLDVYTNGVQDRGLLSFPDTSVRSACSTIKLNSGGYISANIDSGSITFSGTKNNTIYISRIK